MASFQANQHLCCSFLSIIALLSVSEISTTLGGSVAAYDGLCLTWSEILKKLFSLQGLFYSKELMFLDNLKLPYRKVPKFLDARKLCCYLPKIQRKRPNRRVFRQKDANDIANSEDPDQTAPLGVV